MFERADSLPRQPDGDHVTPAVARNFKAMSDYHALRMVLEADRFAWWELRGRFRRRSALRGLDDLARRAGVA